MQEASLRLVLKGLGVPDHQLQDVRRFRGVAWILGSGTCVYRSAIFRPTSNGMVKFDRVQCIVCISIAKGMGAYEHLHVKGLLTHNGFVIGGLEPRVRPLYGH